MLKNRPIIADSWFSPAGLNRGIVRGAVKLAFNPTKTQRDELVQSKSKSIATFQDQGTVLFGDKTWIIITSAFDRINVRRLFITLEKAISTAAKFQLFEFNDEFTRANFRNIVEPFLREVQGRRGITDFLVVCDETNNTGEVIDRNEFVAEIFVKPARSINFITLQFIATRTGVSFDEVAGNSREENKKCQTLMTSSFSNLQASAQDPISLRLLCLFKLCTGWWRNRRPCIFM